MLALVLAFVLVWYTLVVPAHAGSRSAGSFAPDDEGLDGEVRGVVGGDNNARAVSTEAKAVEGRVEAKSVDELDWPEFIYPYGD